MLNIDVLFVYTLSEGKLIKKIHILDIYDKLGSEVLDKLLSKVFLTSQYTTTTFHLPMMRTASAVSALVILFKLRTRRYN